MTDVSPIWQQARGDEHLAQAGGSGKAEKNVVNVEETVTRLDG